MTGKFISIPKDSFTILVGFRDFIVRTLADIPMKFRQGNIVYIHSGGGHLYLHPSAGDRDRIEFRQERNIIDIIAMLESDPARFVILAYDPAWFFHNEEYIGPCGYVCRKRSGNRQEVLLISEIFDSTISELESMADKLVCVQDSLTGSFSGSSDPLRYVPGSSLSGGIQNSKVKKSGQQSLMC